jgi:hypothetical protein
MALELLGPRPFFCFLTLYTVGKLPRTGAARLMATMHRQHKNRMHKETTMSREGLEPTTSVFDQADSSCFRPRY